MEVWFYVGVAQLSDLAAAAGRIMVVRPTSKHIALKLLLLELLTLLAIFSKVSRAGTMLVADKDLFVYWFWKVSLLHLRRNLRVLKNCILDHYR